MAVDKSVTRQENVNKIADNETFDTSAQDIQDVNATMINDMVVDGLSLGGETDVFTGRNDGTGNDGILEFRTLKAGPNITLALDGEAILITGADPSVETPNLQEVLDAGFTANSFPGFKLVGGAGVGYEIGTNGDITSTSNSGVAGHTFTANAGGASLRVSTSGVYGEIKVTNTAFTTRTTNASSNIGLGVGMFIGTVAGETTAATTMMDIGGNLRIREITDTTESEYLVVNSSGVVSKRNLPTEKNFLVLVTGSAVNPDPNSQKGVGYTALNTTLNIGNPQGSSPSNLTELTYRIKDDGVARALLFGDIYRGMGVSLPTTTTPNKTIYIKAIYNADEDTGITASGTWEVVSVIQEA
jgi:hypothetical protein